MKLFKQLAASLPERWQGELKRLHYGRQITTGIFETSEPEYDMLPELITTGDWVIDVGANVGHYTKRFSELVGPQGRVIAFEPVPATFSLLAANVQLFPFANVTLVNTALSDKTEIAGMAIPKFATGLSNYYQAQLNASVDNQLSVMTLSLDSLCINQRVALVKIDAEGHESFVLSGMLKLLERHHPILIVETGSRQVLDRMSSFGYAPEKLPNSPNILFR